MDLPIRILPRSLLCGKQKAGIPGTSQERERLPSEILHSSNTVRLPCNRGCCQEDDGSLTARIFPRHVFLLPSTLQLLVRTLKVNWRLGVGRAYATQLLCSSSQCGHIEEIPFSVFFTVICLLKWPVEYGWLSLVH